MFERFTDEARRLVVLSQEEARLLNHDYIGTEHVLLALTDDPRSAAAALLATMGVTGRAIRHQLVELVGQGTQPPTGHMPFTPRAKEVLVIAVREANARGDPDIRPEHLLLGIVGEGRGLAVQILAKLGADLERLRQEVVRALPGAVGEK